MKRFVKLLSLAFVISFSIHTTAHAAPPVSSDDVEIAINGSTTRTQLAQYTAELASLGITLNVVNATFNSANQVMTISFEIKWSATDTDMAKFQSDNVRAYGDIWIIHNSTTSCVGHCK